MIPCFVYCSDTIITNIICIHYYNNCINNNCIDNNCIDNNCIDNNYIDNNYKMWGVNVKQSKINYLLN